MPDIFRYLLDIIRPGGIDGRHYTTNRTTNLVESDNVNFNSFCARLCCACHISCETLQTCSVDSESILNPDKYIARFKVSDFSTTCEDAETKLQSTYKWRYPLG